jgi:hypothetical protein
MPKAKYLLMPNLLTPEVNPGKAIEFEIFITGGGPVEENKLYLTWPSAIINKEDAGEVTTCIKTELDTSTGCMRPISGENCLQTFPCTALLGKTLRLSTGFFLEKPGEQTGLLSRRMAELKWDDHPPALVKLNTDKEAPSGDYDIGLALSYSSGDDIEITKETVKVHIRNWVERHPRIVGVSVVATIAAFIVSVAATIISAILHG